MATNKRRAFGKRAAIALGAVSAVVIVALAATHQRRAPASPPLTALATVGDVEHAVLATGSLQPVNVVDVGAEVSGRLVTLKVKLGDHVRRGDVIGEIDPERLRNDVRQQQNSITQAEATLRDRLAQLNFVRAEADRQKTLLARGASSQVQYDVALANLKSRTAQTDNQRQQIQNQRLILEQRQKDLEKTVIRAPTDGIIAEVVTRQGQVVNTSREVPIIARIASTETMLVRTLVSEADIMKVRPGQKVYFTILGQPAHRRYATIKTRELTPVGASLDPGSGGRADQAIYYNVTFETPNEDEVLLPSMTAQVHVVLDEANDVVTVPSAALAPGDSADERTVEVVAANGQIEPRDVIVGVDNNFVAEIRQGLKPGERVVVASAASDASASP